MEHLPRTHRVVSGGLGLSPQLFCSRVQLFQPRTLPSHFCALSMLSAILQINLNPFTLSFKELSQFHSVIFSFHAQHYQPFKPSLGRSTCQSPCSCSVDSCPAHLSTKCPEVAAICQDALSAYGNMGVAAGLLWGPGRRHRPRHILSWNPSPFANLSTENPLLANERLEAAGWAVGVAESVSVLPTSQLILVDHTDDMK